MAELKFGIQFYPWHTPPELIALARRALDRFPFDMVWVADHLSYENVFVSLAAVAAQLSANVGTSVTQPFARTPVDLAASFATLSHLVGKRQVAAGIGTGAVTSDMILKSRGPQMVRETVLLLRELFAGRKVPYGEFPCLTEFFRLDPKAQAVLRLPPSAPLPILVAAAGERMLRLAGEIGDGLILANFSFPTAMMRRGALERAFQFVEEGRRLGNSTRPFTKVLHLHVSVARDGRQARQFAKRHVSIPLSRLKPERMVQLGITPEQAAVIRNAYREGLGPEAMEPFIPDDVIERTGISVAGTAGECLAHLEEILSLVRPFGIDLVDMAVPLGPRLEEAIDIVCSEILPELRRKESASGR